MTFTLIVQRVWCIFQSVSLQKIFVTEHHFLEQSHILIRVENLSPAWKIVFWVRFVLEVCALTRHQSNV